MSKVIGGVLLILGAAGTTLGVGTIFLPLVLIMYARSQGIPIEVPAGDGGTSLSSLVRILIIGETIQRLIGSLIILLPSLVFVFLGKHLYYKNNKVKEELIVQCEKCKRTVVQGLTRYIVSYDFFYGPSDKDSKWPRKKVQIGHAVGEQPLPPEGESVYGGKCDQCHKTYCVICMNETSLDRLAKISADFDSDASAIETLLDENGELYCPQCGGNARTVKAW